MSKQTKDFEFKQFKVHGGKTGMPVSTDGVLLGAWANIASVESILDIGTGTGLLALMCAQRNSIAKIAAIDIDEHAVTTAELNFRASPWQRRLAIFKGDVLDSKLPQKFEHIICNPPYFNSGEIATNTIRAKARHTHTLHHQHLIQRCFELLTDNGKASFILPTIEAEQVIDSALQEGWFLTRKLLVQTTERKPISRLLFELSKQPQPIEEQQLSIHSTNKSSQFGYNSEFIELTKMFYLKM